MLLGTSIYVVQLIVVDLVSLAVATVELQYMNNRQWMFEPALCPIYLGFESITTTASIYFIIGINLHAISTYNLAIKTKTKNEKLLACRRSSDFQRLNNENDYESTLCAQQNQRSLTIDYSKKKDRISVVCPIIFIWILSVSVSVPLFTFGVLLPNRQSALICGMENFNRVTNIVLQILVLFIRIVIPLLCLIVTVLCVAFKYFNSKSRLKRDVRAAMRLGFVLSVVYVLFSTQRVFGSLMFEIMTRPFMQYKYPNFDRLIAIALCMVNYTIPAIRPFIYLYADKKLRTKICQCCRRNRVEEVRIRR